MQKTYKNTKGVITVFIALMLTAVLSFGTLVLELGRFQTAKTQLAQAASSAATSMIAAYDSDLYENYGLLAIDTERFTEERYLDYLNYNSDLSATFLGNNVTRMYTIQDAELSGMYNLTYPSIFKRQILTRAKYHIVPTDFAINVKTATSFLNDLQNKCDYVSEKLESVSSGTAAVGGKGDISGNILGKVHSLYATYQDVEKANSELCRELTSEDVSLLPSATGTVESLAPDEDIEKITNTNNDVINKIGVSFNNTSSASAEIDVAVNFSGIPAIKQKLKDVSSVTDMATVSKETAASTVMAANGVKTAISMLSGDKDGAILLNSYLTQFFSNRRYRINTYNSPDKDATVSSNVTFTSACTEYLFGGNASEVANQESAYDYIFSVRYIYNLYSVISGSATFRSNNCYSVAGHMALAYYRTFEDMDKLLKGKTVDICGTAFDYKNMLSLALWFLPNSEKLQRAADLIQLEMRYKEQYVENKTATFLMSNQNTYCRIKTKARFHSILPVISDSAHSLGNVEFETVKYSGY